MFEEGMPWGIILVFFFIGIVSGFLNSKKAAEQK